MSGSIPEELSTLADSLTDAAHAIDQFVNTTLDPFSPQGSHLKDISTHIAFSATQVRGLAVEAFGAQVAAAVSDLTANIKVAGDRIGIIANVQKVLSLAAALLSVAAAVATKDPVGTVSGVANLIDIIKGALAGT